MDEAGDASVQLSDVNCWIVVRRLQGLLDYLEVCTAHFLRIAPLRGAKVDQPRNKVEDRRRSEEHTSELQSLMRISYAVFCLKKKTKTKLLYIETMSTRN